MDRLDYELAISNLLEEACSKLNSKDFEKLLSRLEEAIKDYE